MPAARRFPPRGIAAERSNACFIGKCVIRRKAANGSEAIRPPIPTEVGHPGEPDLKLSMSAIESRTTPSLRPCKGRSDARRESADAEGSKSSEIEARPWGQESRAGIDERLESAVSLI